MIVVTLLVLTFFAVVVTGPAGVEYFEKRRALLDAPRMHVHLKYLPSSVCRERPIGGCPCEPCRVSCALVNFGADEA